MKKLEDLHPESARRLATLLSYNIGLSEKDLQQVKKEPKEWLSKMLYGDESEPLSSLALSISDDRNKKEREIIDSNLDNESQIFKLDTGFISGDNGLPQVGKYHLILDLGNKDLVRIDARVDKYQEFITVREIEFDDVSNKDNLTYDSLKKQFECCLRGALRSTENYGQNLRMEDITAIFNDVITEYPEIESIMNAQKIKASIEGEKKPSVIRRNKL